MYKVKVFILPKQSVLDPQGVAVKNSLNSMSYNMIDDVRIGKYMEIMVNESDKPVEDIINEICDNLLANPIMENYSFTIEEVKK